MPEAPKDVFRKVITLLSEQASVEEKWLATEDIDPNLLFNALLAKMRLQNDSVLAQRLQVTPPIIQMIRDRKLVLNPSTLLLWIHEGTGISQQELQDWLKKNKPS